MKAEKERGDRTIRELKDQITALEDQLNEYAGAINDQSKVCAMWTCAYALQISQKAWYKIRYVDIA